MRTTRRTAASVVVFGLCAAALAATPAAAASASVALTASCAFPDMEPVAVTTTVSVQLPDAATTTEPVAMTGFSVSVTVPEATVAALRTAGTTTIGAGITAALTGTWQQQPHDITVPAMTAPDNPLPESGDLPVTATAEVPPVAVDAAGDATFAVPQVITTLTVHNGDTVVDVPCTEDPGQDGTLGTIAVTGTPGESTTPTTPSTGESTTPTSGAGSPTSSAPGTSDPKHPNAVAPKDGDDPPPEDVGDFDDVCKTDAPGTIPAGKAWYKIDGPLHVLKLNSDLIIPVGDLVGNMYLNNAGGTTKAYACVDGTVLVPDAPGYFVMFNFAPVTAVAHTLPGAKSRTKIRSGYLTSRTEVQIRLSDVKVNGVPLDVGPNCHTSSPAVIRLAGPYQSFVSDGKVPGLVDIPPFTGCAHGSDVVNPLFNGLVAGKGNTFVANIKYICFYVTCQGKPLPGTTPATK